MADADADYDDLRARVTARRLMINREAVEMKQMAPESNPKNPPPWFDADKFAHAQKVFSTYSIR